VAKAPSRSVDLFDDPPWDPAVQASRQYLDWESRRAWEIAWVAIALVAVAAPVAILLGWATIFRGLF
jgi:hypothetical protein